MKKFKYAAWMMAFAMVLTGCSESGQTMGMSEQGRVFADGDSDADSQGAGAASGENADGENTLAGELVSCIGTDGSITLTIPEGWR